jgi:putative heme transporter
MAERSSLSSDATRTDPPPPACPPGKRGSLRRAARILRILLFPAVVLGVFVGILPRIADLDQVWETIRDLSPTEELVLVALTVWNVVTYWPMLVAAMPGLSLGQAAVVCQTSTSVAMTLPGGGALAVGVSYAMYTSWGFSKAQVATSAFMTFIANMSFKLLLPVVSLGFLAFTHGTGVGLLSTAIVGLAVMVVMIAVLALVLRAERFARRLGAIAGRVASYWRTRFGRPPVEMWDEAAARLRSQMVTVVRDRWLMLSIFEVVSQLSVFLVLLASVRFVGIPIRRVSTSECLAVFAFVRLATSMPIIPGNVGIAELGYIGGLALAGGPEERVVAAVLVFRFLTFFAQIPLGGLTYLLWRRNRGWRKPPPVSKRGDPAHDAEEVGAEEAPDGEPGVAEDGPDRRQEEPSVPTTQ